MPKPPSRSPPISSAAPISPATATATRRTACWPRCRRARSRWPSAGCPSVGEPPGLLERLGVAHGRRGHRARDPVARPPVRARPPHRRGARPRPLSSGARRRRLRFSFDMLGEGARTERDALRYLAAYDEAIRSIAAQSAARQRRHAGAARRHLDQAVGAAPALRGRATRARDGRSWCRACCRCSSSPRAADINLTIDAEESDRLELSLDVFDALAAHVQQHAPHWTRLRPGGAGLPDARDRGHRRGGAHRPRTPPALHGAAGQGRLLGRRDQARAGRRLRRLPGVHAQAAHRHRLPGRRACAARRTTT